MAVKREISVIVVSYNTRELLLECIASVLENRKSVEVEIVIIDNASTDGSVEAVRGFFPELSILENGSNLGFAAACNQGIRASRYEFILLLNSDARLLPGALEALLDCMANERCAAAGCRVLSRNGGESMVAMNFLTPFNQALELAGVGKLLGSKAVRRTHPVESGDEPVDCSVDWIEASCLLLRRSALNETGFLDERFFMYSEDEDLCFRLRANGGQVCFTKSGSVIHQGGASAEKDRTRMLVQFYLSQMRFLQKHRGSLSVEAFALANQAVLALKRIHRVLTGRSVESKNLAARLEALQAAIRLFREARDLERSSV
ncbi:MAG: hypothetical protein DMF61_04715 [Blastocatellia bacterium AA13]|nr:MAG: hypothetical protein DMF61_04715 [Blastocatellia bacterium AA13]